jgi:hypothetical protein
VGFDFMLATWFSLLSLIIGPFFIGCVFEEKIHKGNRDLGSPLRRY